MAVGSVVNAVAILRHLAGSEPLGVNALARALGLNPSTCFAILKTLAAEAFVDFDPDTKTYRLGLEPGRLFHTHPDLEGWIRGMGASLRELARQFSVTCGLWEARGERLVLLNVAESPRETRIHLTQGQRLPIYLGAMGRCIAAREQLQLERVAQILPTLRWESPPTPQQFLEDMRLAQTRGWASDEGNYLRGVTTVAAAVCDGDGRVRYCLTSILFSGQYDPAEVARIGEATAALAREGERRLVEAGGRLARAHAPAAPAPAAAGAHASSKRRRAAS